MKGAAATRIVAWGIAITLVVLPVVGVMQGWFAAGRWPVTQLKVEAEFAQPPAGDTARGQALPAPAPAKTDTLSKPGAKAGTKQP